MSLYAGYFAAGFMLGPSGMNILESIASGAISLINNMFKVDERRLIVQSQSEHDVRDEKAGVKWSKWKTWSRKKTSDNTCCEILQQTKDPIGRFYRVWKYTSFIAELHSYRKWTGRMSAISATALSAQAATVSATLSLFVAQGAWVVTEAYAKVFTDEYTKKPGAKETVEFGDTEVPRSGVWRELDWFEKEKANVKSKTRKICITGKIIEAESDW